MLSRGFIWKQELEFQKQWENNHNCLLFSACLFTSLTYLNIMVWLRSTFNCHLTVRNRNIFYLATFTPSFINLKYSWVLELLNVWGSNFVHPWDPQNKMLGMKWDMLYSVHLHDRYDKPYISFSFSFHSWVG